MVSFPSVSPPRPYTPPLLSLSHTHTQHIKIGSWKTDTQFMTEFCAFSKVSVDTAIVFYEERAGNSMKRSEKYSVGVKNKYTREKKLTVLHFPQQKR